MISALSGYAKAKNGIFRAEALSQDDDDASVVYSSNDNTSLLFPQNSLDWDASKALSLLLKKVVLALHIQDGDLWMYELYKNGNKVDGFNPIPDYWV